MAWRALRIASRRLVRQRLELRVEGQANIPERGPVIIAARHFHHLYDGTVMMATMPRPLRILVGLDWVEYPAGKALMTRLCSAASWPVVMRPDNARAGGDRETLRALRRGLTDSLATLEAGDILLIFPEGYPNIDPGYTPKTSEAEFLPFQPGFVRLASLAASRGLDVPIVPAGFSYTKEDRWQVHLRFGGAVRVTRRAEEREVLQRVEADVHRLSLPSPSGSAG